VNPLAVGCLEFLQHLTVNAVNPGPDIPADIKFPADNFVTDLDYPVSIYGKGIVIDEKFMNSQFKAFLHLIDHVLRASGPKMFSQVRAPAKGALEGAATAGKHSGNRLPLGHYRAVFSPGC